MNTKKVEVLANVLPNRRHPAKFLARRHSHLSRGPCQEEYLRGIVHPDHVTELWIRIGHLDCRA